jgi:hypothetical protein
MLKTKTVGIARTGWEPALIVALGLAFSLGVIYEWSPLNGVATITKWEWPYQNLGTFRMALALLAPFSLIAWIVCRANQSAPPFARRISLAALVLANFCLQLFSVLGDPRGWQRIPRIVSSANATSYFTDATAIQRLGEWLAHFHQARLHDHSATHPPGPILFYYVFAQLFGTSDGALIGGCAVGLVASLGVALMYRFAGLWTNDYRVRILASAFYALLPALTVFFPEFDQVYPVFSMMLILTFVEALRLPAPSYGHAIALGAALFLATFFAYNLLTVGVFLVYYGLYWLGRQAGSRTAILVLLRTSIVALGLWAALYVLLWMTVGYNAPAAFRHSLIVQAEFARRLARPYLIYVFADLYDFALGAGIIAILALFFYLLRLREEWQSNQQGTALTLIGLATVLTVDLSGVLRGETARVWLFLQPLLVVPVAVILAGLRWPWRLSVFAVQWWILVCIKAKMSFIEP